MSAITALTISQISVFFIFMSCGYIFKKTNSMDNALGPIISRLEVWVFMPALCFNTFAGGFRPEILREKSAFLITGTAVLAVTFGLAIILSRLFSDKPATRGVYLYAFTSPNFGYMGYPLIQAVYGDAALLNFMIIAIPYNFFVYTIGRYVLSAGKRFSFRNLLDPSLIGITAGMAAGLAGLKLPAFAGTTLNLASGCMAPMAMIMMGFVLARTPFKFNISNPRIYLASFLRLLVIPLTTGAVLLLLGVPREAALLMTAFLCMPMGLNNVVFPEAYGGDSGTGAQSCFVSQILGALTIPVIFALIDKWG
jgi:predicted permease